LVVAHLVGDWLLQTEYQAMGKASGRFWNKALVAHCLSYTVCFLPVLLLTNLSLLWLILIFGSHLLFDRRWPVIALRRLIKHDSPEGIKATFWVTVAMDQVLHVLVLAIIASLG